MSAPFKVSQEQYDRLTKHLTGVGKNKTFNSTKFLNPKKEEGIVRAWRKNNGGICATCRDVKSSAVTVRKVLRKRGLIL